MNSLNIRSGEPELMDDPAIDKKLLQKNLRELDYFNRFSGGHKITLEGVRLLTAKNKLFSIVDLGCGSGDTLKYIANWARRKEKKAKLIGVDFNIHAIQYLKRNCQGYPEITGMAADYLDFLRKSLPADIYICSLFCHHLDNEKLLELFRYLRRAREGFVINDLRRSKLAYYCAWFFTRLLNGTELSRNDGPVSVLRAFRKHELESLLHQAGCHNFLIKRRWPFRFLVVVQNS